MISHIHVDGDECFLVRYPGSLREAGRAIQDIAGAEQWTPGLTPEITRAILRELGIWDDEDVAAPDNEATPYGEPYWMIYTRDDLVCLGCGEPEFLSWDRQHFVNMKLSEAQCRRLVRRIQGLSLE